MPIALITGASRGLGEALARRLAAEGWCLVLDARGAEALEAVASTLPATAGHEAGAPMLGRRPRLGPRPGLGNIVALAGDVADPSHRAQLVEAAAGLGGLDALVNNASILGPSPQPALADYPVEVLRAVYEVNVIAPLALAAEALPLLRKSEMVGRILNITSDAGVEAYEGWAGYGSSKAALEHASRVLALEEPDVRVYVVDPGDMRTQMQQEAFPGEDISDRPPPEVSVPGLLPLLTGDLPSGRYVAKELGAATA